LAQPADITKLFRDTTTKLGRIDVLVNNAAVAPLALFDELTPEVIDEALQINIRAVIQLTQDVWRQMKKQGQGVIVNISSLAAVDPFPGFSLYGATKAWLDLMTMALAREGQEWGIQVFSIRPGAVETPMLRNLFPDFPKNQCLTPEQVADAVWKCVSEPTQVESGKSYALSNQSV
jgi:NAD(P)-dependent dehydrogenase (short-subunit alcohol dehydrogenase family)